MAMSSNETVNEEEILSKLKDTSKNIYKVYEVKSANNDTVYVNTLEEAENLVNELKEQYGKVDPNLTISEFYLDSKPTEETIKEAKANIEEELTAEVKEKEKEEKTINGIYIACRPVSSGTISSRFGSRESIRNHTHKGIDIAASDGTKIKAAADGVIKSAGYNDGGYGNLVVIDHGNGITTYYAHCSQIYVSVGQKVTAGDVIAAVGSTGNSTGNHLHFEIRQNGTQVNPEKYIY